MRLGIDFGGTNVKFGLFEEDGREIAFRQLTLADLSQNNLLENLVSAAKAFIGDRNVTKGGFAAKGLVNPDTGIWHRDVGERQYFADVNLRDVFTRELGSPFAVDNDARAYAWGEWLFGAGRGSNPMVCMTLGTGIGSALVIDGKPYKGADPAGGLLGGHISIDRNGPVCSCGNRGCLELYCSATALTQRVLNSHADLQGFEDILIQFFDEIRQGNREYRKTLRSFIDDLAIGIVNVIHAYGPQTVVLGGGVMNSADLILPELIDKVHSMAWTFPRKSVEIKNGELGNRAAALGIAFHPFHNQ
ncbi:MAG: hypothetical protein DRP96_09360 [Candidatus Neomarinimicrobiota bacterium]|nr:MAG: hypothetical protein DRP96_09360 [Candidatus Neomarinimicrobiota bacterium]